jgi:hypothetical protein
VTLERVLTTPEAGYQRVEHGWRRLKVEDETGRGGLSPSNGASHARSVPWQDRVLTVESSYMYSSYITVPYRQIITFVHTSFECISPMASTLSKSSSPLLNNTSDSALEARQSALVYSAFGRLNTLPRLHFAGDLQKKTNVIYCSCLVYGPKATKLR